MAIRSDEVRDLVDRLENLTHADEREFARNLQITPDITDDALDELFLSEDFDRCRLLKQLSVTNIKEKSTPPKEEGEDL